MANATQAVLAQVKEVYGNNHLLLIFGICLAYLFFFDKEKRKTLVLPSVLALVLVINPVTYRFLWDKVLYQTYWRALWLLPVLPVVAYTAVRVITQPKKAVLRLAALAAFFLVIGGTGSWLYGGNATQFVPRQNWYKNYDSVIKVCDELLSLEEKPRVVMNRNMYCYTRQYSADIYQMFGRDVNNFIIEPDKTAMQVNNYLLRDNLKHLKYITNAMDEGNYTYLVRDTNFLYDEEQFAKFYMYPLKWVDRFVILERADTFWRFTSHASATGAQSMCYTITNQEKYENLVIIDGGYTEDAGDLYEKILKRNGHVTAWIITHPDADHAGAFNAILTNPDIDITIDHIYCPPMNLERYLETARSYDETDEFRTFYELAGQLENVTFLKEGDTADILGLRMEVLHSWDEDVDALEDHVSNNGSLVFRLSGDKESFLFTGDISDKVGDIILERHPEAVKADYVQCAHHGNWGLGTHFYEAVAPKGAFMDGPDWLIRDTTGRYDAPKLKSYFDELGIPVYTFADAPNSVVLR